MHRYKVIIEYIYIHNLFSVYFSVASASLVQSVIYHIAPFELTDENNMKNKQHEE